MTATGTEDYVTEYNYNDSNGNYTALLQKEVKTVEKENELDITNNVKQTVYTYDKNGNQIKKTADGKTETNTYDGLNQLIGFTDGTTTASYKYNEDGLRYEKTVNDQTINHVWDSSKQIVADVIDNQFYEADCYIRGTNLVAKYNYQNGNKSEYTYYTQNAHGDVVNLTDETGKVTKTYTYDAFGVEKNIDENDTNAFRYCGEYYDAETGTIYLRARYYDPSIGRFISRDSYTGDNIDPLSLNLYTYCLNNPMHFVDENGHWPSLSKIIKAAATVAVAAVAVTAIVATAGAAGAAVGVAAGMYLGVSSATAVTISTAATVGAYAVAGGIGATALSDAGEELTGTNVIRDGFMGGNQELYDTVRGGLYTVGAGYMALGADNCGLSSGRQSTSTTPQKSSKTASGYSKNGNYPKPGERTLNGYVKSKVEPGKEISLRTSSPGFNNNNGNVGGVFKRFGNGSHAGVSPHVHQPNVNIAPNGNVYGSVGSKTVNGGVTYPTPKDVKQLYEYIENGKYH